MNQPRPFEFDAHKYRQASSHQQDWGVRLIAELELIGNERILDLGCGDGRLTARLAELVPDGFVVGIDASHNMVSAAQAFATDRLSFRQQDINDLADVESFDLVFSNATLHWVHDHRNLLRNVARALRSNGRCRFNFAADGNCSNFNAIVRELMSSSEYQSDFQGFQWPWYMPNPSDYKACFEGVGFVEYDVWEENADRHFPDATAMTAWIDQPSLVPFLNHIAPHRKQAFRAAVVERLLRLTQQSNGTQFETFRRINVLAKKQ